jgi:hypothetical protein
MRAPERGPSERAALRQRAGTVLVVLGHRLGGTPPPFQRTLNAVTMNVSDSASRRVRTDPDQRTVPA